MDLPRISVLSQTGLAQNGLAQKGLAQNGSAQNAFSTKYFVSKLDLLEWICSESRALWDSDPV
jgi:hypothetical protein